MRTTHPTYGDTAPTRRLTYANVMSTLAVLMLLVGGGTAVAAGVAKNSVTSRSVKNESIASRDLKDGAAVASSDVVDDSLTGADIDESTFGTRPTGTAGGGLTGTYPNPSVGPGAVSSGQVADGSLTEADLGAGSVTSSELGTITMRFSSHPVPAGEWDTVTATCPAGEIALSGGGASDSSLMPLIRSRKGTGESWEVRAYNGAAETRTLAVSVSCLAP